MSLEHWAVTMYQQGHTFAEIGRTFGRSRQRIEQIVRPVRHRARTIAGRAYLRGELPMPPLCMGCNVLARLFMHHEDYSKPLAVRWLCKDCHTRAHGRQVTGIYAATCPVCGKDFIPSRNHAWFIRAGRRFSCRTEGCKRELRRQINARQVDVYDEV